MNVEETLKMLKENRSSHFYEVHVPSLGRKLPFLPMRVSEVMSMSKIALDRDNDFYPALTALVLDLCTEKIDTSKINEIDRLKMLLEIKQNNQLGGDTYRVTCKNCQTEFRVTLDVQKMIENCSSVPAPKEISFESEGIRYDVVVDMPSIELTYRNRQFKKSMIDKIKASLASGAATEKDLQNAELYFFRYNTLLFVKSIRVNGELVDGLESGKISVRNDLLAILPVKLLDMLNDAIASEESYDLSMRLSNDVACPKCKDVKKLTIEPDDFFQI